MNDSSTQPNEPHDDSSFQQLLVYAREFREHYQKEQELENVLSNLRHQFQDMSAASVAAQEEERQWIAYEVHDRIAQTLASAFQQLQILGSLIGESPEAHQLTVRASSLLREAMRETRNIMNDLHPPLLDEFGVGALIEEELYRFQESTGCSTTFHLNCPVERSNKIEVAIYRIFHEALINVGRHAAGTRNVVVSLECQDNVLTLEVQDDGCGFDAEVTKQHKGVGGLMSMQRRADIMGGVFELSSTPGKGTRVSVKVSMSDNG